MAVKKSSSLLLLILIFLVSGDCGGIGQRPKEPTPSLTRQVINPGDKIGNFLITTAGDSDVFYISKTHCPFNNDTKTEFCELPEGTRVNVALAIFEDNAPGGKSVDDYWKDQTYKMYIEGYPINLEAFGVVNYTTRREGKARIWDVVVVSDQAGTISVQSTGVVGGNPFDYTAVVTYKEP